MDDKEKLEALRGILGISVQLGYQVRLSKEDAAKISTILFGRQDNQETVFCRNCDNRRLDHVTLEHLCGKTGKVNFVTGGERFEMSPCSRINPDGKCPNYQVREKCPHWEKLKDDLWKNTQKNSIWDKIKWW